MSESHSDWSECSSAGTEVAADGRGAVTFGAGRESAARSATCSRQSTPDRSLVELALTDLDLHEVLLGQRLARDGVARVLVCPIRSG
jgi:hypothetical protein